MRKDEKRTRPERTRSERTRPEIVNRYIKSRALPLAALAVVTALTFPVIALGMDEYTITDGTTSEVVTMYDGDVTRAVDQCSFDMEQFSVSSVIQTRRGFDINLKKNFYVTLTADGENRNVMTWDSRVSGILRRAGVELSAEDLVEPSADTIITEPCTIKVVRVTTKRKTMTQKLAYTSEIRESADLEQGRTRVAQEGIDGVEEITLEYTYHDGEEVATAQIDTQVIKEPVSEIIERGTRQPTVVTTGGKTVTYSRVLTVEATAYSGGGLTANGMAAQVGRIAVDPSVIPLGTKLYITSADGTSWVYGEAVAADTGGAIKGNRIDLYFNTEAECSAFGRKQAKVYILN